MQRRQEIGHGPESESPEARASLEKMSRRVFLERLAAGAAVLGLGGLEATLSSGCASHRTGLKSEEIQKGMERFRHRLDDPFGYSRHLKERELVIRNEIFDAYARTVDKRPAWLTNPVGGYMSENYLDKKEEKDEFRERLVKIGLTPEEIEFFESLFTSADIIIFRESVLKEKFFLKALPHERFHKAMKQISNREYEMMRQTAQEMMGRKDAQEAGFVQERYYRGKTSGGFYVAAAGMNWEEFYTYLAQGEFIDSVEQALKDDYPEAYKIFSKIKEDCEIKQ